MPSDRLIGLGVSVSYSGSWGRGFDSRYFHKFKNVDYVWNGTHASWGQMGSYLIEETDLIKEVDFNRLEGA